MTPIDNRSGTSNVVSSIYTPFRFFRKWWNKIENSAISPEFTIKESARIRLLNRLCLGVIPVNVLVAFLNFFLYEDVFDTLLVVLVVVIFTLSFFQSRAGRYGLSRWLIILPIVIILDILTCTYGRTAGGSISFLIMGVAAVILFENKLNRYLALGLLAGSFVFTEWYIDLYQIDGKEIDVFGVLPPLIFTINFFIMLMILLYLEEFLLRSQREVDLLLAGIKDQNEALVQTNYELAHFANTASHHFQSPLRNITSMLGVMDRTIPDQLPKSVRTYVDLIKGDAKQLYQFVGDILVYARIGQGENWSCEGKARLETVVRSAAEQLEIPQDAIMLEQDYVISMNPDHLHVVMVQLLDNAIKYNRRTPEIRIEVQEANDPHPSILLSVIDNGIGVEPSYHEQIFGMFSRLHTQDEVPGSGIGLAVCDRILKQYGGQLQLSKSDDNGSEFVITIPAVQGGDPAYD